MQNGLATVNQPRQLFVEGREEVLLFDAFLRELRITDVQIQNCRGKDNLGPILLEIVDTPDFHLLDSIGIVRDADNSAPSALQSVQGSLQRAGLAVPNDYVIPAAGPPQVSVFIMPDNAGSGALEHLCLSALADDPAMPCVDDFLRCLDGRVPMLPRDEDKARIHAFLASREDPELRLGEAAQRGYISWGHPAFDQLAGYLRTL